MKVNLCFVPPGGGEVDHALTVEMPMIPRQGDYISIGLPLQNFIVKRTWWNIKHDENTNSYITEFSVECEYALHEWSGEDHKRTCEGYQVKKGKLLKFDDSMY